MAMPRIEKEKLNEVLIPESISENDRAKLLDLISTGFPAWRDRFQSLVNAAIERIRQCNPRVLMCMCAYRVVGYKLAKHHDYDECRWRSIEFIQNILVTHKSQPIALSEEDMIDLCATVVLDVEELYMSLFNGFIFVDQLVPARITNKDERNFIVQSTLMYIVRGKRDVSFHDRYFSLLLTAQDDNLKKYFGVRANDVITGIERLYKSLYFSKAQSYLANVKNAKKEFRGLKHNENGFKRAMLAAYDRANKDALDASPYDVESLTGWPRHFISEFVLPLAKIDMVADHEYQFWPLDDFVIKDKPFIEIEGRVYCFDYYTFVDNIYHAIFKACIEKEGNKHGNAWSNAQTIAIEGGVSSIFSNLLPGAKIYQNLEYKGCGRNPKVGELDVVIVCAGMLIVVETKGMEYVHDSPMVNPEKILAFYQRSVRKAGDQTRRFLEYVNSESGSIVLKDKGGNDVIKMKKDDIGRICRICVISDSTNEVLACTNKLETIKTDAYGFICLTLDDLLIYERYFDNCPMVFLAYLSRRLDASYVHKVIASDELDHLGLYIANPDYVNELQKYDGKVDYMSIDDNRRELDDFFLSLRYPEVKTPRPYLPDKIKELLSQVWQSSTKSKLEIATFVMDLSREEKDWLASAIEGELSNQRDIGVSNLRGMPAERSRNGVGISLIINSVWAIAMPRDVWLARVQGMMIKFHESTRSVLCLNYDPVGDLLDCRLEIITSEEFDSRLTGEAEAFVKEIDRRVVAKARLRGNLGRNDLCPCGSGKKYKKCCGR